MAKTNVTRDRLSIDVFSEEHKKIKVYASLHGQTIREYVLEIIRERLRQENKKKEFSILGRQLDQDPVLKELWNNKKDAAYDKL